MSKGFVYIFTNPCLQGWVKIGMTDRNDVDKRLNELNMPANIPLSFRKYATYEVENALEVEHSIHAIIDATDNSLRARETQANGRIREREFFQMSEEGAFAILSHVAKLQGNIEGLHKFDPTAQELEEERIATPRRAKFSFEMLEIPIGSELTFVNDNSKKCYVVENNKARYDSEIYTLTGLAKKLLVESGRLNTTTVQGSLYFLYENEKLTDRRDRLEAGEE